MKIGRGTLLLILTIAVVGLYNAFFDFSGAAAMQDASGLIQVPSQFSVVVTGDRLETLLQARRLRLFARINHAQNAAQVGKELPATELLIFGNPNVGTPLMQCNRTVAIDLPQKALIWEDDAGQVWLAYNDPHYLLQRHGLSGCETNIERISQVLRDLATAATQDAAS
jgi:uncharacterized protein (DUF302 family)